MPVYGISYQGIVHTDSSTTKKHQGTQGLAMFGQILPATPLKWLATAISSVFTCEENGKREFLISKNILG